MKKTIYPSPFSLRLPKSHSSWLKKQAEESKVTAAQIIRNLIEDKMNDLKEMKQ